MSNAVSQDKWLSSERLALHFVSLPMTSSVSHWLKLYIPILKASSLFKLDITLGEISTSAEQLVNSSNFRRVNWPISFGTCLN